MARKVVVLKMENLIVSRSHEKDFVYKWLLSPSKKEDSNLSMNEKRTIHRRIGSFLVRSGETVKLPDNSIMWHFNYSSLPNKRTLWNKCPVWKIYINLISVLYRISILYGKFLDNMHILWVKFLENSKLRCNFKISTQNSKMEIEAMA